MEPPDRNKPSRYVISLYGLYTIRTPRLPNREPNVTVQCAQCGRSRIT